MKIPLYVQLYSLRREFTQDPEAALRSVPSLGFDGVELAGTYGWSAEKWQELLKETGLTVVAAHVGLDSVEGEVAANAEFHKAVGNSRLVVPWIGEDLRTRDGYKSVAARLNKAAEAYKPYGINVYYHNHDFELFDLDGTHGLEILMAETDPQLVGFEVDTYWLERGGKDSYQYVVDNNSRIGLIHAKELRKADNADVPAGQGDVNFRGILSIGKGKEWPTVVEFEGENAPAAVSASAKYLRTLLDA
ncbi:MAG: sugar phosphate isomerase/epimerase family protein [Candidatus Methylacidiphilales bacterium]|nr:sugar phosphate isomerase/epimerase [Candidatus Methylacidiphilales bacterium]